MNTPTTTRWPSRAVRARLTITIASLALMGGIAASPAHADELIASDTAAAPAARPSGVIAAPVMTAAASIPAGIVVSNHAGQPVSLYAKGERTRHGRRPAGTPVTFTHLTPGRLYTVVIGGVKVGSLTAITRPASARGLTVRTTDAPDAVRLTWQHRATRATGGRATVYLVSATSTGRPTLRASVRGAVTTTLTALDPSALYTFTVVPRNSAGTGRGTRAVMTRTLDALRGASSAPATAVPVVTPAIPAPAPVPATPPAPTPAPAPAPAPQPSTKTVYVCPTGYPETPTGLCQATLAYTYTKRAYTYHSVTTGPAPLLDSYETTSNGCPGGYSLEDYGWVKYCRRYGAAPTEQIKDAAPTGFTDDGAQWTSKDPAPSGYTDDGTRWVKTVAKEAVIVAA